MCAGAPDTFIVLDNSVPPLVISRDFWNDVENNGLKT